MEKVSVSKCSAPSTEKDAVSDHDRDEKKSFTEEVPITSDNQYEEVADDDNYPDGGLRAWLNVLGALACGTATFGF
ncbi:hypothetical protein M422DRAFT_276613, partial [Sphaerobolus stellatus SS14]